MHAIIIVSHEGYEGAVVESNWLQNKKGKNMKSIFTLLCASMLFACASANANLITLDQSYVEGGGASSGGPLAQTFTIGISGILDSIRVEANFFEDVTLDIYTVENGLPSAFGAGSLASISVPDASLEWLQIDLSAYNIGVTAGEMLAFVIQGANNGIAAGYSDFYDTYDGGRAYELGLNGWVPLSPFGDDTDFNFQTFVSTNPIPAPATLTLFMLGLCALRQRVR